MTLPYTRRWRWSALFITALVLWSFPLSRSLDLPSWHEFDYSSIARNYFREGANILLPRIDWRRTGPGFTEMEFPIIPWLMSRGYLLVGIQTVVGRLLSLAAALGTLAIFSRLALLLLATEEAALVATGFLIVNRILGFVSTALQPESLMLLFYIAAVYAFLQWQNTLRRSYYWIAIGCTSMAILAKSPAAHLGIFFLALLLVKSGWRGLLNRSVWLFAVLALLMPAAWYIHAHSLWVTYGNSMGLSNENHWIDWDFFKSPKFILGFLGIESVSVAGLGAIAVAIYGLMKSVEGSKRMTIYLWFFSLALYYLVTIRTVSANWAWYYHVTSLPPWALSFGLGYNFLRQRSWTSKKLLGFGVALISAAVLLQILIARKLPHVPGFLADLAMSSPGVTCLLAFGISVAAIVFLLPAKRQNFPTPTLFEYSIASGLALYLFCSVQLLLHDFARYATPSFALISAEQLVGAVPPGTLILTSGGICHDATGHRTAYDSPEMFYWLDRKGFSICIQEQSLAKVQEFARSGAREFVAQKDAVSQAPGFERDLRSTYRLRADSPTAWLFDLGSGSLALRSVSNKALAERPLRTKLAANGER